MRPRSGADGHPGQAVKVESGKGIADTIRFLTDRGIPWSVMAACGRRPVNVYGGFKAKGRFEKEREKVLEEARAAD